MWIDRRDRDGTVSIVDVSFRVLGCTRVEEDHRKSLRDPSTVGVRGTLI